MIDFTIITIPALVSSLILYIVAVAREEKTASALEKIQEHAENRGKKKLEEKAEELAERQFSKLLKEVSAKLKTVAVSSVTQNFDLVSKDIIKEKENLLIKAREEVAVYKKEKVAEINKAVQKAVFEVVSNTLRTEISHEADEKYILSCLEKFLHEIPQK